MEISSQFPRGILWNGCFSIARCRLLAGFKVLSFRFGGAKVAGL